jgi:hypothetical protein
MSNVISFLESLGQDARLARLSGDDYAAAVRALPLDDDARQALLAKDAGALNDLLGGRPAMVCALFPAEDTPARENDDGDSPQEDTPDEQKESIGGRGRH